MSNQMRENAYKLAFIVNAYPDKDMNALQQLFVDMPGLDFNCAAWLAEEMDIVKLNQVKKTIEMDNLPEFTEDRLGEDIVHLQDSIIYTLNKFALEEADLQEEMLSTLCMGYKAHDIMIAMKDLLNNGAVRTYRIIDSVVVKKATKKRPAEIAKSAYVFYALAENYDKEWGKSLFKGEVEVEKLDSVVQ